MSRIAAQLPLFIRFRKKLASENLSPYQDIIQCVTIILSTDISIMTSILFNLKEPGCTRNSALEKDSTFYENISKLNELEMNFFSFLINFIKQ